MTIPASHHKPSTAAWYHEHIKLCADIWHKSGVSRVMAITKASDDLFAAAYAQGHKDGYSEALRQETGPNNRSHSHVP